MFRKLTLQALLAGFAVAFPSMVRADFQYSISTTTGPGLAATPFGSNPGNFNGTVDGFTFSNTSASWSTSPSLGVLNSTALTVTNGNAGTASFTLMVSVNGLTAPISPLAYASTVSGNWSGNSSGSSASLTSYFGSTGVLFGMTNPIAFGPFNSTGLGGFDQTLYGPNQTYSPDYSITHVITVTLTAGATVLFNFRTEVSPVPEPATMTAGLIGLGCMAVARFRRRNK